VRDAGKIQGRLESFADEFSAILSRQIDERAGAVQNRGAA
jgi:biopolymer transport protein TolQ